MNNPTYNDLLNYFEYMSELGVEGLQLEESPFFSRTLETSQTRTHPHPAPPRVQSTPTPTPKPDLKGLGFDTQEILKLANLGIENEITKMGTLAGQVQADTPGEILRKLYQTFNACKSCVLHKGRTHFVFGEGPEQAVLMFVGEGPGYEEDMRGRPFVGPAGQLLDKIIQAMGFQRNDVFIANVVKCRPPDNRAPLQDEMRMCGSILERQVQTIRPKIIVALGKTALSYFMQENVSIMRLRGNFFEWKGIQVMPTYHPAYILRNPASKRDVWEDMKKVMVALGKNE